MQQTWLAYIVQASLVPFDNDHNHIPITERLPGLEWLVPAVVAAVAVLGLSPVAAAVLVDAVVVIVVKGGRGG